MGDEKTIDLFDSEMCFLKSDMWKDCIDKFVLDVPKFLSSNVNHRPYFIYKRLKHFENPLEIPDRAEQLYKAT